MSTETNTVATYATADELLAAIQPASGGREILDPATGELVGRAPEHEVADLEAAIASAHAAQPGWDALGHTARRALMNQAADAIEANAEALAHLLSREQGKPLNGPNARFEVGAPWPGCVPPRPRPRGRGRRGRRNHLRGDALPPVRRRRRHRPVELADDDRVWQLAPALRMGNTVVMKPSEYTPLSVLALVHVINQVLPEGVLHVVAGGRDVGQLLSTHKDIDKVMFTGSTATGKAIVRSSADTVKRLTLEMGGNDAGIVLPDADPKAIAEGLFWGAFINTGQTCAALKRLYVHADIYEEVCQALTEVAKNMPMGVGLDEANVLGPLQNKAQYDIVDALVRKATDSGARVLLGANPQEEQPDTSTRAR